MASPSGDIYLLSNVPLTASYEHTIDFESYSQQYAYFRGFLTYTRDNYTYIRKEREYIVLDLPLHNLDNINYLMFRSADGERLYYAFVTEKVYVNPKTTQLYFTIDVMQTYMFDFEWRESYIKQSHVDRWNAEHKPIYSKTDEGLDYGTDYSIENAYSIQQSDIVRWLLVTMVEVPSTSGLKLSGFVPSIGNFKPVESTFACYLLPVIMSDSISRVIADDGGSVEQFSTYAEFVKFMLNSALGNYVRSISLLTYNPFIESQAVSGEALHVRFKANILNKFTYFEKSTSDYVNLLCLSQIPSYAFSGTLARADWDIGIDSLPTAEQWAEIKEKPRTTKRDKRFESKLLCAPYRYNLLTDWRSDPVIFKNEYMTADKIEIQYRFALSPNAPFRFWVKDYKKDPEGRYTTLSQPLALEMPIISDQYYTYMLENKNTIQANLTNSIISGATGAISGAISGAGVGGVGGAIFGGVTGAVGGALNVQAHVRSENAKQADLKMKPDSVICGTDSAFNIVDNNTEITFYRMRICCENEEIISQIFNMTGYKVNRVDIPNTRSRLRFNYIQTVGANIVGSFNQNDLLKIKEIFDRGITIWHYSDEDFNFLDYSYENVEINLL